MNNITSSGVCENWNNNNSHISHTNTNNNNHNNPSMVSFVGLQNNNSYKQFWDWETNNHTPTSTTTTTTASNLNHNNNNNNNNVNPFMTTQTNFFDYTNLPTLSSTSFNDNNFISPSQFPDYSAAAGFLKKEEDGYGYDDGSYYSNNGGRIGLNLGHRTYFSSRETSLIDRLFRRPRGFYQANQVPRCQAEGCKMDLTNAKHYHRRHKVCELHSKATKVIAGGLEQRFCQQCSRFHVLAEFDQAKRSCRKRLADHNRRRRKPQIGQTDSVPAKTAENVGPPASTSRSEHKEMSLSSSANLPLMISTFTNSNSNNNNNNHTSKPSTDTSPSSGTQFTSGPALSLGCEDHQDQRQPFIFNQNSADMFHRETSVAPYHNLFTTNSSNHAQHQQDDLQSLLHMRQNLFEVELL